MITAEKFQTLLDSPESSILDFKAKFYDFNDDLDDKTTVKFIKDIISFGNTIRTETAYIVFGVKEKTDNSKELLGISESIDDAILQQKALSKIAPTPNFHYYIFAFKNLNFGILEFPIIKYEVPLSTKAKLKNVPIETIFYRQSTSNTIATLSDIIKINDWLCNLPEIKNNSTVDHEISNLIQDLTALDKKLSTIMASLLAVAKKYSLTSLSSFAMQELQGLHNFENEESKNKAVYRTQNIYMTGQTFQINLRSGWTGSMLQTSLVNDDRFFKNRCLFNQPLIKIEEWVDMFKNNKKLFIHQQVPASDIFDDTKGEITALFFESDIVNVYNGIRQKTLDILMETNTH